MESIVIIGLELSDILRHPFLEGIHSVLLGCEHEVLCKNLKKRA